MPLREKRRVESMSRRSLFFAAAGLAPTAASAAPPKYQKQETAVQAAPQTELTKPTQKPKEEKKKPTLEAADVFGGFGEQLKAVTDSQIKVLQRLIDNTSDDDP